jgi:hypothetical protein
MKKLKNILHGWWLFITSDKATNKMAAERGEVCHTCPFRIRGIDTCSECGCFLPAKRRVKDEDCPHNFWT